MYPKMDQSVGAVIAASAAKLSMAAKVASEEARLAAEVRLEAAKLGTFEWGFVQPDDLHNDLQRAWCSVQSQVICFHNRVAFNEGCQTCLVV